MLFNGLRICQSDIKKRECNLNCVKDKKVTLNFDINGNKRIKFRRDKGKGLISI